MPGPRKIRLEDPPEDDDNVTSVPPALGAEDRSIEEILKRAGSISQEVARQRAINDKLEAKLKRLIATRNAEYIEYANGTVKIAVDNPSSIDNKITYYSSAPTTSTVTKASLQVYRRDFFNGSSFPYYTTKPITTSCVRYVSSNRIYFEFSDTNKDLLRRFVKVVTNLPFVSDRIRQEFINLLPTTISGTSNVINIDTPLNIVPLDELMEAYNGLLPDTRHVGWIGNRLLNIVCYLDTHGIAHPDISEDQLYVDVEAHKIALLGGWEHAMLRGEKLQSLPSRALMALSIPIGGTPRTVGTYVNIKLVKDILLRILKNDSSENAQLMRSWCLRTFPDSKTAWKAWEGLLKSMYGPPKYVDLSKDRTDILADIQRIRRLSPL